MKGHILVRLTGTLETFDHDRPVMLHSCREKRERRRVKYAPYGASVSSSFSRLVFIFTALVCNINSYKTLCTLPAPALVDHLVAKETDLSLSSGDKYWAYVMVRDTTHTE